MKKPELFTRFGIGFAILAGRYSYALHQAYGSGIPKTVEEWLAEAFVGFLWVTAAGFIAVGRHIGNRQD